MLNDIQPPKLGRPKPKRLEPLEKPWAPPLHEQAQEIEPDFKTPEETAAILPEVAEPTIVHSTAPKKRFAWLQKPHWPPTRKQSILYGAITLVLAFGIGAGWTLTHHKRTV